MFRVVNDNIEQLKRELGYKGRCEVLIPSNTLCVRGDVIESLKREFKKLI
jgi:hypothetical protein